MKLLSMDKRVEIVAHLIECNGIRATARLCGVDKNTVMALLLLIGAGCMRIHDRLVRNLMVTRVECDELTAPLHTRQINLGANDPKDWGHYWTYIAFATVSKLVIAFAHGKRSQNITDAFMWDLRRRLTTIPELVTDGLVLYEAGVARSFGLQVDYAMLIKTPSKKGKESGIPFIQRRKVVGDPDMGQVTTSRSERFNSTVRDHDKRFARDTRCHSKKAEYHAAHFAILAVWYNLVKNHMTLRTVPGVAAGIISEPWSLARLVEEALAAEEAPPIEPTPLRPREGEHKAVRQLPTGGWLRVIDGGKTRPGLVKVPGIAALKPKPPVKAAPPHPMKQMDLFDPE